MKRPTILALSFLRNLFKIKIVSDCERCCRFFHACNASIRTFVCMYVGYIYICMSQLRIYLYMYRMLTFFY